MTYTSEGEMIARLGNAVQQSQLPVLAAAIVSACTAIDVHCGQSFAKDTSATARVFEPTDEDCALVDPFWTATGLVIQTDDNDDGVFETTWSAAAYELVPFSGARASALAAPYDTIRALGALFPTCGFRRRTLQVTAQWGWAAVPQNVVESARILAADLFKRREIAFGIATGTVEFGGLRIGRDVLAQVASLLQPFVRADITAGIG